MKTTLRSTSISFRISFTAGFKFNLRLILFCKHALQYWSYCLTFVLSGGPYAPFDQRWHLRQEYKIHSQREALANQYVIIVGVFFALNKYSFRLSRFILLYGIANLLLSPFIFIWQVLNLFYGYTEVSKHLLCGEMIR